MKNNKWFGIAVSIAGFFTGLLLFYYLSEIFMTVVNGKNAGGRPDEALAVIITHSMLGWIGISASALWGAVLYGFAMEKKWAWYWGTIAASLQMLAGFFPTIPAKSIDLPAPTMTVFLIATVLWFATLYIGKVNRKVIGLVFVAGLAYVLTYIDGVAIISKYQTTTYNDVWKGMYAVVMMVTWWGATAWLVFSFAVLRRRTWAVPLGVFAALMSMIGGYPLAVVNIMEVHRFSMFLPGPMIATILLPIILLPKTKQLIEGWKTVD